MVQEIMLNLYLFRRSPARASQLAFLPKLNRLFVANGNSGELKIYDDGKFRLLKTISGLPDADNARSDVAGNSEIHSRDLRSPPPPEGP